jgi:hypothetical protein
MTKRALVKAHPAVSIIAELVRKKPVLVYKLGEERKNKKGRKQGYDIT